jgi:purine-cytosine permease-like protein
MDRPRSRQSRIGRWAPLALYAFIVLGWFGVGMSSGAQERLWLVVWALPAPATYLWRTRRSGT